MTKRFIAGLISLILLISALPTMAAPIGEEFYGKISETVIIEPESVKMLKYGRVEKFTENNVGTAHYADEILVIPIRFLAETFYGQIDYDNVSRKCVVSFERAVFEYEVGSKKAVINDEETELSLSPFLNEGTTYVPLVDFITAMGMGYLTGDNGITVISPLNNMDEPYFTERVFDKIYEIMHTSAVEEVTIHVSTTGKAGGEGTKENPLDSIYSARDYIRELKKDGIERKYTVLFEDGTYSLDRAVEFETQDSGSPANPIEYAAAPGADVKFTTGYSLDTWEQYDKNIWRVQLPEPKNDCWILSEGEHLGTKAKYPNEGYLQLKADTPSATLKSFHYTDLPDINPNADLQIGFYPGGSSGAWMWTWWYRYVTSFDKENKRIIMNDGTFDGNKTYVLGTGTKYVVYNALELIDVPGEFYYNTSENYLYYYPYDPENLGDVLIPRVMDMFKFNGVSVDEPVRNITLRDIHIDGVDFWHENYYIDNFDKSINGYHSYEMDGSAVKLQNSSAIHIKGCQFTKIGSKAIYPRSNVVNTEIDNCCFKQIGENAITSSKYANIENCYFDNSGFINLTAVAISVNGAYSHIAHNRVTNMRRTGIQFGGDNQGSVVEYNELDNCMWSSQDGAAIYMNRTNGGVQRNNILRDIDSRYGVMTALYLDDLTKDFKAYNNLVYNMNLEFSHPDEVMAGLSQKSQRNQVYNNIFADLNSGQGMTFNKQSWDTIDSLINYNNVWYNCYDRVRNMFQMYSTIHLHDNLFKKLGGNMFYNDIGVYDLNVLGIESMEEMKQIADGDLGHKELVGIKPEFMNEEERDYRMRYDSMAYAQGFTDINISDIGLEENFKFGPEELVLDRLYMKEKEAFTDKATILLASGESKQLELTAREAQMQMKFKPDSRYISFSSDNNDAVTVSEDGVITGKDFGKAHIVATYDDGKVKKSTDVYVFVDDFAVTQYLSPESTTEVYVAESENFGIVPFIYAKTKLGRVLELNTDIHKFVSDDSEIAVAKKNGKIIGKKIGKTEINLASAVEGAVVSPYKIKVNTVKDFYTNLKANVGASIIKIGERVDITPVAIAKRNSLSEKIPAKLVSGDESIVRIVEEDGTYYVEAVGEGSTSVSVVYDSVPGNEMTKKIAFSVVGEKESNYAGLKFSDISGKMLQSGIKSIDNGHINFFTSGVDVYSANDEFTFLHKEVEGDADIVVTINSIQNLNDVSTSIGPMFRVSSDTNAYTVHFRTRQDGMLLIVWRDEAKPGCANVKAEKVPFPMTVKLERRDNKFTGYVMKDGQWVSLLSQEVEMPDKVLAGVGAFSHQTDITADFEISDLTITEKGGSAE